MPKIRVVILEGEAEDVAPLLAQAFLAPAPAVEESPVRLLSVPGRGAVAVREPKPSPASQRRQKGPRKPSLCGRCGHHPRSKEHKAAHASDDPEAATDEPDGDPIAASGTRKRCPVCGRGWRHRLHLIECAGYDVVPTKIIPDPQPIPSKEPNASEDPPAVTLEGFSCKWCNGRHEKQAGGGYCGCGRAFGSKEHKQHGCALMPPELPADAHRHHLVYPPPNGSPVLKATCDAADCPGDGEGGPFVKWAGTDRDSVERLAAGEDPRVMLRDFETLDIAAAGA